MTYNHPVYSLTAKDWRLSGELAIGDEIMTLEGIVVLTAKKKLLGQREVWNLEVREWHNFLVGGSGVVVHNACTANQVREYFDNGGALDDAVGDLHQLALARLGNLRNLSPAKYNKFLDEFPNDVPLKFGDGAVDIWEKLEYQRFNNGVDGWAHRKNREFLKLVSSKKLTVIERELLHDIYYSFKTFPGKKGLVNFSATKKLDIGDGELKEYICNYDKFGFPEFEKFAPKILDNQGNLNVPKFVTNDLLGKGSDFNRATMEALDKFPASKIRIPSDGPVNVPEVLINGKWIKHTWHHHQDGKTMFLVPSVINNRGGFSHTGGNAILSKGVEKFRGFFDPPSL